MKMLAKTLSKIIINNDNRFEWESFRAMAAYIQVCKAILNACIHFTAKQADISILCLQVSHYEL